MNSLMPVGRPDGALFPAQEHMIDELRAARRSMVATAMAILLSESGQLDYKELRPKGEPIKAAPRVGRNEPCPCGSGKKYKKCYPICGYTMAARIADTVVAGQTYSTVGATTGRTACTESRS